MEYRHSWAYFAMAVIFCPAFIIIGILKGTLFDLCYGGILGLAWALHLVRQFILRRNLRDNWLVREIKASPKIGFYKHP